MTEERKIGFEWWKLIIGSGVAIVVVLVPLIWNSIDSDDKAPQFALSSPIFSSSTIVNIFSRNDAAKKMNNIHVEWDGLLFHNGAKMLNKRKVVYSWEFIPNQLIKDKKLISNGSHKLRFSFDNSKFSDHLQIKITDQAIVSIPKLELSRVSTLPDKPRAKIALIIGNSDYTDYPLQNPVNDANLIAKKLKESGFKVTLGTNLTEEKIRSALDKYAKELGENDTSLIYLAGHGVQLEGINYFLPVDAKISDARDIEIHGIPLNKLTKTTEGLKSQITLYAASPGASAMDGSSGLENSPFASSLAQHLTEPNAEVSTAFQKVVNEVRDQTDGQQIPWLHSTASTNIFLNTSKLDGDIKDQSASIIILDASTTPYRENKR